MDIRVSDDLTIAIGNKARRLTPSEGLALAERIARVSFRRACAEEAEQHSARLTDPPSRGDA